MGKSWDSTGIAFNVELWTELLRICKPGAHLLAFSGSRTYHRMACGIEDAGFEIRDMIEWVYGSGFPKSLNIGKAVDKIRGNEREIVGKSRNGSNSLMGGISNTTTTTEQDVTKGNSIWEGYGTALKPAHEPCVLARKPIKGSIAQNVLEWGTGGLNIDGSRVEANTKELYRKPTEYNDIAPSASMNASKIRGSVTNDYLKGRFPANFIHDGSDEVLGLFPNTKTGSIKPHQQNSIQDSFGMKDKFITGSHNGDSGSAARFFYTAKASKSERNAGLEGFEEVVRNDGRDETLESANMPHNRSNIPKANYHPTVKPLTLTKYLANLIKPPVGGRLLVPFSGSGSEMIGALQAGWEYVEGVELTEEYIPIAEARIKYWLGQLDKEQPKLI